MNKDKYKIGDKVKIFSFKELKQKIRGGLTIKSMSFPAYNQSSDRIFGIREDTYDNYLSTTLEISKLHNTYFEVQVQIGMFMLPYEFIKPNFELPDELFRI